MRNRGPHLETPGQRRNGALQWSGHLIVLMACLASTQALAAGWKVEQGVEEPSYAVAEPMRTNLNIDSLVLSCEKADGGKVLQLQIYLSDNGPLQPKGVTPDQLKDDPRVEISIDGRIHPVAILFAGDYAVLADGQQGMFPLLSDRLLDAMQAGKTMLLRFDLVAERPGEPAAFDGEAVIDLQAGAGGAAVAILRRCAGPTADRRVGAALAWH